MEMSINCPKLWLWFMTWIGILCVGQIVEAAPKRVQPKLFRFSIDDVEAGLELETEYQFRTSPLASGENTHEYFLLSPFIQFRANGSLYHPNLIEFNLSAWQSISRHEVSQTLLTATGTTRQKFTDTPLLLRYQASLSILKHKPYSVRINASRSQGTRNLDFFTTTRIDTESYGIQTGYRAGKIPVEFSYRHFSQDERGLNRPIAREESLFKFKAQNTRENNGQTVFNYSYNDWKRRDNTVNWQTGSTELASISNKEQFGERDQATLDANLRYSRTGTQFRHQEDLRGRINLFIDHTDNLRSNTSINASRLSSGDARNYVRFLNANLSHQLFESLTSSLDVFGSKDQSSNPTGRNELINYGFQWSENYKKQIGKKASLQLGYSLRIQPRKRSFEGRGIVILNEEHILGDDKVVLLNVPGVIIASVRVTDTDGSILYSRGFDYELIDQGELTEIRRVVGGKILDGQTIRVDYRAATQPSGEVTSTIHGATWRLNLWGSWLSLFGRYSTHDAKGDDWIVIDEYERLLVGLESKLNWLRVGLEYEDRESTLTPYRAVRFNQSANWQTQWGGAFSLNFRQIWRTFPAANRKVNYQDYLGRLEMVLFRRLNCSLDAGYRTEKGDGIDNSMVTARVSIDYEIRKLLVEALYQFQSSRLYADQFGRHYLQISANRRF